MKNLTTCQDCQLILKPQEKKKDDKGVSSLQREETQEQDGPSGDDDDLLEDVAPITRPEGRHGQHLVRQLSHANQRLLHEITFRSQHVLRGEIWKAIDHHSVERSVISRCN